MASQRDLVLALLKKGRSITSYEAFEKFGATRLSAIIYDLRKQGHRIGGVWQTEINRNGEESRFLRYFLIKVEKDAVRK